MREQGALEVIPEKNNSSLRRQEKNNKTSHLVLPKRSTREDVVESAVRQALFNTELLIRHHLFDNNWKENRIFLPIVVTNAPLLSGTYSSRDIDSQVNLKKIDLKPIESAAFNHSEILRWGPGYEKTLQHIGLPAGGRNLIGDTRFRGSHDKTVFVVSKNHLLTFIDQLNNLEYDRPSSFFLRESKN